MGRYILLQWKRTMRILPRALCVVLVLFLGLMTVRQEMLRMDESKADNQKFHIAMCGTAKDSMVEMGLSILRTIDATRFSIEIEELTEEQARRALERGEIAAYLVVPENFVEDAMYGKVKPIRYVTTVGATGLVSLFKDEITRVVEELMIASEKGTYGINDLTGDYTDGMELSYEYAYLAFSRSDTYQVQVLGIQDDLELSEYLVCGLAVLFLLLACLTFVPLMIRTDFSLGRVLAAKGRGGIRQALCDFVVFFAGLCALTALAFAVLGAASSVLGWDLTEYGALILGAVPVLLMVASLSFVLYELAHDLISGALLQFLSTIALCFVSGCMYPIFFFPESVQSIARCLPTGVARHYLACCLTGDATTVPLSALLGFSAVFLTAACLIRRYKIIARRG